jgi:hypothetical protein
MQAHTLTHNYALTRHMHAHAHMYIVAVFFFDETSQKRQKLIIIISKIYT